ncbi:hypothetical protein ACE6H2_005312 [Prunus campanulata]
MASWAFAFLRLFSLCPLGVPHLLHFNLASAGTVQVIINHVWFHAKYKNEGNESIK